MWASAAACMRNYLILREKARAFRADPEVQQALRRRPRRRARPTDPGARRGPRRPCAPRTSTPEEAGRRGMGFERLDQLALEHLYGVRE